MLIDRAVARRAARVGQVSTNRALEEALAAFTRVLAVVLAGALVTADDTLCRRHGLLLLLMLLRVVVMIMFARFRSDAPVWNALDALRIRPIMRSVMRK